MYDLTGYSGQTVHIAFVYQATYGNVWAVLDMKIRSKPDPIIPIFARLANFSSNENRGIFICYSLLC